MQHIKEDGAYETEHIIGDIQNQSKGKLEEWDFLSYLFCSNPLCPPPVLLLGIRGRSQIT